MTLQEIEADIIINHLADAWSEFSYKYGTSKDPRVHDDINDFRKCIHDAQRIVIARLVIDQK